VSSDGKVGPQGAPWDGTRASPARLAQLAAIVARMKERGELVDAPPRNPCAGVYDCNAGSLRVTYGGHTYDVGLATTSQAGALQAVVPATVEEAYAAAQRARGAP
jgi:hypothetical protein